MKTKNLLLLVVAIAAMSVTVFYSCKKQEDKPTTPLTTTDISNNVVAQKNIKEIISKLPKQIIVKGRAINLAKSGFSFTDPLDDNFTTENGGAYSPEGGISYSSSSNVMYSEETGSLYISGDALGGGGGGTVVAGTTSLPINYTFCFTAKDEGMGFNPFGNSITGVSTVFGISGDFSKIPQGGNNGQGNGNEKADEEENDIAKYFNGFAMYIVYTEQAQGTYEIVNWLEDVLATSGKAGDEGTFSSKLKNKGFSLVLDFKKGKFYLSHSGSLNVSGGSIAFTGKYIEVDGTMNDATGDDIKIKIVEGFGSMGCN